MADISLTSTRTLWYNGVTYWVGYDGAGISCCHESRNGVLLPFPDGEFYVSIAATGYDVECGLAIDSRGTLYVDVSTDGAGGFNRYMSQDGGYIWTQII